MTKKLKNLIKNIKGQGMVEYGIIIGLISIVVILGLVKFVGKSVDGTCDIVDPSLEGQIGNYTYKKNNDTGLISVYRNITCQLGGWEKSSDDEEAEGENEDDSIGDKTMTETEAKDAGFGINNSGYIYEFKGTIENGKLAIPSKITYESGEIVTIKSIGAHVFQNKGIKSVILPKTLKEIDWAAFANNDLKSVTIPDSVTKIGGSAFMNNKLESVNLPTSIDTIENSAFMGNNLKSFNIPDSIKTIGFKAFMNNKLESVTLSNSIETIGGSAFEANDLKSLTIPASVKTIEHNAFAESSNLNKVTFKGNQTKVSYHAFPRNLQIPENPKKSTYEKN